MKKKKRIFKIRPVIQDKDRKEIISLYKKHSFAFEIDWKGDKGELLGIKGQQLKKDGTFYPRAIGEPVIFEDRNGKKYQICVKINEIRKGFWRDRVMSYSFFVFPDQPYQVFRGKEEKHIWKVDFANKGWHFGRIVSVFIGAIFLVACLLAWFIWSRE